MSSVLKGKNILVTGGTGSIGRAIVDRAIAEKAKTIKIFSNGENELYEMNSDNKYKNLEFLIGNIQDENTISSIVKGVDIVFHTAALKHVDRCESNPSEAIMVNTIGTRNIVKASTREGVKKLIAVSTDKAVNPIGVMGATKLLGEKLISAEALHHSPGTVFASVRFGNVLKTRGSILLKIEKQIQQGKPITITDERMKRFFMTKEDAVKLLVDSLKIAKGGETFVFKMPLLNLKDLFDVMKEIIAPKYGFKSSQIKTKVTGIRPGEKLIEYLLSDFEMENVLETKDLFILPPLLKKVNVKNYPGAKKPKNIHSYFTNMKPISKKEIRKILNKIY